MPSRAPKWGKPDDVQKNDHIRMGNEWFLVYHVPEVNQDDTITFYIRNIDKGGDGVIRLIREMDIQLIKRAQEWVPVTADPFRQVVGRAKLSDDGKTATIEFLEGSQFAKRLQESFLEDLSLSVFTVPKNSQL